MTENKPKLYVLIYFYGSHDDVWSKVIGVYDNPDLANYAGSLYYLKCKEMQKGLKEEDCDYDAESDYWTWYCDNKDELEFNDYKVKEFTLNES